MDGNAILDVSIGLALLYLLISLFVTIANEWISSLLKLRARNLRHAIKKLVDDQSLLAKIDGTPIMKSLAAAAGIAGPSYIPADRFATSVVESVTDSLEKAAGVVQDVRKQMEALPDTNFRKQLISLWDEADANADEFQKEIGRWFDDMMDRASGTYARWMQMSSFLVALALAVLLNVDSIAVARTLWVDKDLRGQIAEAAGQYMADRGDLDELPEVDTLIRDLRPFPIGWQDQGPAIETSLDVVMIGLGWLLTAAAASLGAPFWFGLLEKITKIRGSGKKPERTDA